MAEQKGGATTRQGDERQEQQMSTAARGGQSLERSRSGQESFAGRPFELMRRMSDEVDRMFDRVFEDFGFPRALSPRSFFGGLPASRERAGAWSPRIEAFQEGDTFVVRAELPGVKKDDVDVNITDEAITIQGQRQQERKEQREGYYHTERSYGSFYRQIPLPEGTIADTADASFRDGVLEITLQAPPHEVRRGRKIEIKQS